MGKVGFVFWLWWCWGIVGGQLGPRVWEGGFCYICVGSLDSLC